MAEVAETAAKAKRGNPKPDVKAFGGPSKPLSAYFQFCQEIRPEVTIELEKKHANDPRVPFSAFSSIATERWKNVSAEKMEQYKAKHAEAKVVYAAALEEWKKTDKHKEYLEAQRKHSIKASALKAKKSMKEAGAPKKPATAYFLFMQENSEAIMQHVTKDHSDFATRPFKEQFTLKGKKAKEMYDALTEDQIKALKERVAVAKAKYEEEYAKFKETDAYKAIQKKTDSDRLKSKNMQKEIKNHGKPVKEKKVKVMKSKKSKKAGAEGGEEGAEEEDEDEEEEEEEDEDDEEEEGEGEDDAEEKPEPVTGMKRSPAKAKVAKESPAKKAKSAEPVAPKPAETA